MKKIIILLIGIMVFISCKKSFTDTHIEGYVYHAITGEPLQDVVVGFIKPSLGDGTKSDKTNKKGKFKIHANTREEFTLRVFQYHEHIENNQYETHDYICLDTINCMESFPLSPNETHQVDFRLCPTGKIRVIIVNETSPDFDEIKIYASHPDPSGLKIWTIKQQSLDVEKGAQIIQFLYSLPDGDRLVIKIEAYKDGVLLKTTNHENPVLPNKTSSIRIGV